MQVFERDVDGSKRNAFMDRIMDRRNWCEVEMISTPLAHQNALTFNLHVDPTPAGSSDDDDSDVQDQDLTKAAPWKVYAISVPPLV